MPIHGFVDLHNHQFANLGFGGREFVGSPVGTIDHSLPWCTSVHGPGGILDPVGTVVKWTNGYPSVGHKVGGYPQFDGWPRYDSVTHQSVHRDWLQRAWQGGLRLMIMLAVNNEWMTGLPGFQLAAGRTGDDMEAVRLQLDAAYALQAEIDNDHGGPGKGWYRIVTSPDQARTIAEAGQLAVILGVEVDYLLGSHPRGTALTVDAMRAGVADLAGRGVRYVFPIHFGNNQFGGAAIQNALEVTAPAPLVTPLGVLPAPYVLAEEPAPGYEYRGGQRNPHGLTELGKALIRELIARGMVFDVDHMSYRSRSDALDIAESYGYPVISGHSGYVEICHGDKSHEGWLTGPEIDRITATGGMVCPLLAQGNRQQIDTFVRPDGTQIPHICGRSDNSFLQAYLYAHYRTRGRRVGIGTDFNGFAGLPAPTSGPEADYANPTADKVAQLHYPFTAVSGMTLDRSTIGQKSFDINVDGVAHVGMLPDMVAHLQAQGASEAELAPLLRSAEDFVTLWTDAVYPRSAAAAIGADARAYLFWRGTDGNLWQALGDAHQPLNGPHLLGMGPLGSAPSVGVDATGATYAYWRGTDNNLWSAHWDGTKWVGPTNNGMGPLGSTPAAAIGADARAYLFWRGTDGNLWQALGDAHQPLNGPHLLGMGPLGSAPSVGVDATGATYAYWRGTDNNLWSAHWDGTKWVGPTNNGMGPLS